MTTLKPEHITFLENLRDSGVTNMWGASPYLKDRFNLTKTEASDILMAWIDSFSTPSTPDTP